MCGLSACADAPLKRAVLSCAACRCCTRTSRWCSCWCHCRHTTTWSSSWWRASEWRTGTQAPIHTPRTAWGRAPAHACLACNVCVVGRAASRTTPPHHHHAQPPRTTTSTPTHTHALCLASPFARAHCHPAHRARGGAQLHLPPGRRPAAGARVARRPVCRQVAVAGRQAQPGQVPRGVHTGAGGLGPP